MEASLLPQLARRMLSSSSEDEVALILRDAACHATGAKRAELWLWDVSRNKVRAAKGQKETALEPEMDVVDVAFTEAEPMTLAGPSGGLVTMIPLRAGDRRIGLLVLDVSEIEQIDPPRLASVILLAEHAGTSLCNMHAIEETRDQWALLNNVIESITNGLITIGPTGRMAMMNRNAMAMLGIDSAKLGSPMRDALPTRVVTAVDELIAELGRQGFCMERRVAVPHVSGEELPLAVSVTPLRDSTASSQGFIVVFRDMTASQELERLRHIDEMKSQFVANVSHELKTPLTSIKAYTEALKDMVSDEQVKQFLQVIDEESDRLLYLINDLLNVSRIQSGRLKMHFELCEPAKLVPEVLRIARVQSAKHQLELEIAPELPHLILDRDKIKEVLINLLTNAIKYSPKGGRVWLRMKREENNLRLEVQDEGMGISPEHQANLFQPFFRVDNSLTYEVSGTGLGLAIVKAIVDQHGGRVWVTSDVGKGAVFIVLLPIRTQARREEEPSLRD